jgi:hypothetical protein
MRTVRAYHFVDQTLRDGRPIPADGVWLEETGKLKICKTGLHASRHVADAIHYAPGNILCLVELSGQIIEESDKLCASHRKILARFDATELLRKDARESALSVAHLWKMPDVVRKYLETGDENLRLEARDAAYAIAAATADAAAAIAADAAADAAAYADAYTAAYAIDPVNRKKFRKAARARLQTAVDAKFAEMGIA